MNYLVEQGQHRAFSTPQMHVGWHTTIANLLLPSSYSPLWLCSRGRCRMQIRERQRYVPSFRDHSRIQGRDPHQLKEWSQLPLQPHLPESRVCRLARTCRKRNSINWIKTSTYLSTPCSELELVRVFLTISPFSTFLTARPLRTESMTRLLESCCKDMGLYDISTNSWHASNVTTRAPAEETYSARVNPIQIE